MSILLTLAIVLSSQPITWAAPTSSNQSLKLPVAIGVNHYKIFDKDGNNTEVSFVYKPDVIEVIVQPSGDSNAPSKVIKIPQGSGSKGGKSDRDKGGSSGDFSQTPSQTVGSVPSNVQTPGIPVYTDISKHWARDDIMLLSVMGIMKGYPDGTFRPDGKITRAEFAALFERVLEKTTKVEKSTGSDFLDVPSNAWFATSVARLEGHGNIQMKYYPNRMLYPGLPIPRQEMVAWMAAEVAEPNKEITFADEKDIKFVNEVKKIAAAKLVQGFPDGTFRPNGVTTRAEAASVMVRFMRLKGIID
ncbi:hypothetical protein QO009_004183 [Brevibacillus aydinogluensis]|uniref:S-layer homology domain-containing protein n=1 Tax=Brevibacillus aydinogluensis TaxID=927786 RepID=UPI0028934B61|nr:S-layer homology domain-containing protein [Brevibacillus aydinogluensis]MDT3418249.1 hypothetical protein [Brevibacillus aydinogluensis]